MEHVSKHVFNMTMMADLQALNQWALLSLEFYNQRCDLLVAVLKHESLVPYAVPDPACPV